MSAGRRFILGTAGHVDHGKSALIKALTGVETDRLKEEQERGISIELGFAEMTLADGTSLGVVDVPGHERFVRQMVAGAGGVDLALLVVAADEGVMPQTVEHLEILAALGVRGGVIVITKLDLVERELAEVALEEVRELARGTFLQDRPAALVSARTGEGLDDLRAALAAEAAALPDRGGDGPFRLPVDRVFTMPGAGVVVTGTCWSGETAVGDVLELAPAGAKVRVRDVQAHGRAVARGGSGQRLALALHGVKKDEVERGFQVVAPGACVTTLRLDARIDLVAHFDGELKNRQRLHVHHAGREVLARATLLDVEVLSHDSGCTSGLVQLQLEAPLVARRGDRLVLRFYSPLDTMAGGRVLHGDPPRRRRFDGKSLAELAILEQGDPAELFRQKLREAGTAGLPAAEHAAFAADAAAQPLGKRLYDRALLDEIADRVAALAEEAWRLNPLRGGVGKEEARRKARFAGSPAEWQALIEALAAARGWSTAGDRIGPARSDELPDGLRRAVDAVESRLRACGLDWPGAAAVAADLPAGLLAGHDLEEHLRYLAARGRAVMVADDYPVHVAALDELRGRLRAHFAAEGSLNFGAFRELTGLSRKLGIPLLEHLDAAGVTRRVGDLRTIGPVLKKET